MPSRRAGLDCVLDQCPVPVTVGSHWAEAGAGNRQPSWPGQISAGNDRGVRLKRGDTIEIAGQRIRFSGIDAPESAQRCKTASGKSYACGRLAANARDEFLAASRPATCRFLSIGTNMAASSAIAPGRWPVGSRVARRKRTRAGLASIFERRLCGTGGVGTTGATWRLAG